MSKDYEALTAQMLDECRQSVGAGMRTVYGRIEEELKAVTPGVLVQKMIDREAEYVNDYAETLVQSVKQAAIEVACKAGVSSAAAGIIWANVMDKAGVPKVALCKREKMEIAPAVPARTETHRERDRIRDEESRQDMDQLMRKKRAGIAMAAGGTTAILVTCLVSPGLGGMRIMVKGAEVLLIGAGAFQIVQASRKLGEINRIAAQPAEVEEVRRQSLEETVKLLCDAQCKANLAVFEAWLDTAGEELVRQIEHELG